VKAEAEQCSLLETVAREWLMKTGRDLMVAMLICELWSLAVAL
jgi:hypothetical protein